MVNGNGNGVEALGFRLRGAGRGAWRRGAAKVVQLRLSGEMFRSQRARFQSRAPVLDKEGIPEIQDVSAHADWAGGSCLISGSRDKRPLSSPPKVKVKGAEYCPVCQGEREGYKTWRTPGETVLSAYLPRQPIIPHQINIPLPLPGEHKTNIGELLPEEFIRTLLFARQIIDEQLIKVAGANPVAFIHLGVLGYSHNHPLMVVGAIMANALYPAQARFDLAARYWHELKPPRDVIWEECQRILGDDLFRGTLIQKVGGELNPNRGWLVHTPFTPILPYHLRVSALREGAFNLSRLSDDEVAQLGYSIWMSVHLLGKLTSAKGEQAFNNLAINFEMVSAGELLDNPKARMYVDIVPQENCPGGIEFEGLPLVADPLSVAKAIRPHMEGLTIPVIDSMEKFLRRPVPEQGIAGGEAEDREVILIETRYDSERKLHRVRYIRGEDERPHTFRWREPWHGLHTTVIMLEWIEGPSKVTYSSDFTPDSKKCFACDPEQLAYPHFALPINKKGQRITFVTNAFGSAGGEEIAEGVNPFDQTVEVVLGAGMEKLRILPAHLLGFAPEHAVTLRDISYQHGRALVKAWQQAALKLFRKSEGNNRLVCLLNLGQEAGASLGHYHFQMIEIPGIVQGTIEKQIAMVDAEGKMIPEQGAAYNLAQGLALLEGKVSSRDLMAELLKDVEEKRLVLFDDDNVVVYAEDAPMFPYEVVIRAKRLGANNLIYLTPQEVSSFAKALEVIRQMYVGIEVQDLAIVDESARYDNPNSCWRYAIRLMPRRVNKKVKRLTALDIKGIYLVPVSPEDAVRKLLGALKKKQR